MKSSAHDTIEEKNDKSIESHLEISKTLFCDDQEIGNSLMNGPGENHCDEGVSGLLTDITTNQNMCDLALRLHDSNFDEDVSKQLPDITSDRNAFDHKLSPNENFSDRAIPRKLTDIISDQNVCRVPLSPIKSNNNCSYKGKIRFEQKYYKHVD